MRSSSVWLRLTRGNFMRVSSGKVTRPWLMESKVQPDHCNNPGDYTVRPTPLLRRRKDRAESLATIH